VTESGITRGTLAAQLALLLLGYGIPDAPQWARASVALLAGCLGALSAALQTGAVDLAGMLPIVGQGLAAAVAALGLTAGVGVAQQKRRRAGVAGRHGTGV
jgi:hypothetical protein